MESHEKDESNVVHQMFLKDQQEKEKLKRTTLDIITIDVGGKKFKTRVSTFSCHSNTTLGRMFSEDWFFSNGTQEDGSIFLDRNPIVFSAILEYYRTGILEKPNGISDEMWNGELNFYNIYEKSLVNCDIKEEKSITESQLLFDEFVLDYNRSHDIIFKNNYPLKKKCVGPLTLDISKKLNRIIEWHIPNYYSIACKDRLFDACMIFIQDYKEVRSHIISNYGGKYVLVYKIKKSNFEEISKLKWPATDFKLDSCEFIVKVKIYFYDDQNQV